MDILIRNVSNDSVEKLNQLAKHLGTTRNVVLVEILEKAASDFHQDYSSHVLKNGLDDVRLSLDKLTEAENKSKEINSVELGEIKQALQYIIDRLD